MGQKVDPRGLRLGIVRDWDAKWYAGKKDFSNLLLEDVKIRDYIKSKLLAAGISRIHIERTANRVRIAIHTAKPGVVIGRGGTEVEVLLHNTTKTAECSAVVFMVEAGGVEPTVRKNDHKGRLRA